MNFTNQLDLHVKLYARVGEFAWSDIALLARNNDSFDLVALQVRMLALLAHSR